MAEQKQAWLGMAQTLLLPCLSAFTGQPSYTRSCTLHTALEILQKATWFIAQNLLALS
jgi:hypothetical protein